MSIPAPPQIVACATGTFTIEELNRLERYCDGLALAKSGLGGPQGAYNNDVLRVTQVASMRQARDIMWFYEHLGGIVRTFNERTFRFDLRGFSEPPQYMVYRDSERGHFDWHMDTGSRPPRKLSLTIQLSEPTNYEGGDLQFNLGATVLTAPRDRGAAIAFPSHTIHRVTPITSGTRKAIVAWVTGPDFK